MERRDKINYYLDIAETVCERGTCLRRNFGAIIVHNDEIIATGYNGAPRGLKNCSDLGICTREKLNVPKGQRYELCPLGSRRGKLHNQCFKDGYDRFFAFPCLSRYDLRQGTLCGEVEPCSMCKRLIINAGIKDVFIRTSANEYKVINVESWIENDPSLDGSGGY